MKKILAMAIICLATSAFADTSTLTCKGLLIAEETKNFGGGKRVVKAEWKLTTDATSLTIGEGEIKLTGPVKNGVASVVSAEKNEKMTLSEISDENGDQFLEVHGKTFNKGGMLVANVSGVIECK
jgi:hypothetical protein